MKIPSGWSLRSTISSEGSEHAASPAPAAALEIALATGDAVPAHTYLLVDPMRQPSAGSALYEAKIQGHNLMLLPDQAELSNVSPVLIDTGENRSALQMRVDEIYDPETALAIVAPIRIDELLRHLRRFLMVRREDGHELHFRFYDPRVLSGFLPTCSRSQIDVFFGPVNTFFACDPRHGLCVWPRQGAEGVGVASERDVLDQGRLVVRETQIRALRTVALGSFEARVYAHLQRRLTGRVAELGAAAVRELIAYGIARAARHGIRIERNVCRYIDLMVLYGAHFDRDPANAWARRVLDDQFVGSETERVHRLIQAARERSDSSLTAERAPQGR